MEINIRKWAIRSAMVVVTLNVSFDSFNAALAIGVIFVLIEILRHYIKLIHCDIRKLYELMLQDLQDKKLKK